MPKVTGLGAGAGGEPGHFRSPRHRRAYSVPLSRAEDRPQLSKTGTDRRHPVRGGRGGERGGRVAGCALPRGRQRRGCCATRELSAEPWGGLGWDEAAGDRLKTDVCAHSWFTPFSRN